jgi:Domain of unknown function (DUF5597)/Glycosyl hydrolases family 35
MQTSKTSPSFHRWVLLPLFPLVVTALAGQTTPPIPRLVHTGSQYHLLVDGKPFLILGGQAGNSSASNKQYLTRVWESAVALHANTVEIPLYWELIEAQPGQFDFHTIDDIIQGARSHQLRLVLLWFGTWKNGRMSYTPGWIKEDQTKYFRVRNDVGQALDVISPFCATAREADARAFSEVMQHIKSVDSQERTVIMMQVENETGLEGTDRDYSPQAMRTYQSAVPSELMQYLEAHRGHLMPAMEAAWVNEHYRRSGTWPEVFGDLAPEAFSAWYVACYVDAVAAAGKKEYPLPMYCNNWLEGPAGAPRAGDWPRGGPTIDALDIWKAAAPHIDFLSPDIYSPDFLKIAAAFRRPNNPLFVPETGFAPNFASFVFADLAEFNGIGFSPFGIDRAVENGKLSPVADGLAENYRVLEPLLPLIEKYRYTGKMYSIVQGVGNPTGFELGHDLAAMVSFTPRFRFGPPVQAQSGYLAPRGGGIIIELAQDDYIVAGSGFRLDFRNLEGTIRTPQFLSIDEGTYQGTQWVPEWRLNGDEQHVDLFRKPGILRVRLVR